MGGAGLPFHPTILFEVGMVEALFHCISLFGVILKHVVQQVQTLIVGLNKCNEYLWEELLKVDLIALGNPLHELAQVVGHVRIIVEVFRPGPAHDSDNGKKLVEIVAAVE